MHQEIYEQAEGLRRSDLWKIHQSPKHFKQSMEQTESTSASLTFGIAVHKYILEPDTFFDEYAITPKIDRRTKNGKLAWEAFSSECEENNKEPIDEPTFEHVKAMAEAINQNPLAKAVLTGQHETEYYWTDRITGEKLKAKCDNLTTYNGKQYVVDYKTTDSCEDGHFERSSKRYGYQFQAAFYLEAVEQSIGLMNCGFMFVAQEKKPPYACRVYACSDAFIETGRIQFRQYLDTYHECKITNNWYGYEGPAVTPQPTLLMDDSERYASRNFQQSGESLYQSTFNSDDFLDENAEQEEYDV